MQGSPAIVVLLCTLAFSVERALASTDGQGLAGDKAVGVLARLAEVQSNCPDSDLICPSAAKPSPLKQLPPATTRRPMHKCFGKPKWVRLGEELGEDEDVTWRRRRRRRKRRLLRRRKVSRANLHSFLVTSVWYVAA